MERLFVFLSAITIRHCLSLWFSTGSESAKKLAKHPDMLYLSIQHQPLKVEMKLKKTAPVG